MYLFKKLGGLIQMINFFRRPVKNSLEDEIKDFISNEKDRRREAKNFLKVVSSLIFLVADEVLEINIEASKSIKLNNKNLYFDLESKTFYIELPEALEEKQDPVNILSLKGKLFWENVKEVMKFTDSLLDDIFNREQGRNQLVDDMKELTREIVEHPMLRVSNKNLRLLG